MKSNRTEPRPVSASAALQARLAVLIDRGDKGKLHDSPEVLALCFEMAELLLTGRQARTAHKLQVWYMHEAILEENLLDFPEPVTSARGA